MSSFTAPFPEDGGEFEIVMGNVYTIFINPMKYDGTIVPKAYVVTFVQEDEKDVTLETRCIATFEDGDCKRKEYDSAWFGNEKVCVAFHFDENFIRFTVK